MNLSTLKYWILTCVCLPILASGQEDHVMWASVQLQTALDDNNTLSIKPILRLNDDISDYQNSSIDISIKSKIDAHWSFAVIARTWFLPDRSDRQFLWFDVAHGSKFGRVDVSNRLRYHWGWDIHDREDLDFFRWSTRLAAQVDKMTLYLNIEPWFSATEDLAYQRIRWEPGVRIPFGKLTTLDLQYRMQRNVEALSSTDVDMVVVNLVYKLPKTSKLKDGEAK